MSKERITRRQKDVSRLLREKKKIQKDTVKKGKRNKRIHITPIEDRSDKLRELQYIFHKVIGSDKVINMSTQYEKINNICFLILAATAVTVALIYTRSILIPFVIAFFLYAILSPIIEGLNKKLKWPRVLVVMLVTIIFIVCITLISIFIINSLNGFSQTRHSTKTGSSNSYRG